MIALLSVMTLISFSMRALPFFFSESLHKNSLFEKLVDTLPPCILLILVAHTLEETAFIKYPFGIPEMVGLGGVVLTQILFRNVLTSMLTGVLVHQLLLHVL